MSDSEFAAADRRQSVPHTEGAERVAKEALPKSPKGLSDLARGILGSQFGIMGRNGSVTYQTPWNRSPLAIAAYDELVGAGCLSVEYGTEGRCALTYRPLVDTADDFAWVRRNLKNPALRVPMMVPDEMRQELPPRGWVAATRAAVTKTRAPSDV